MPLKIQNYGDWDGDAKQGHHPPNCTCYRCNEMRNPLNYEPGRTATTGGAVKRVLIALGVTSLLTIAVAAVYLFG